MAFTIIAAVLIGVLHAYSAQIQVTTLWAGRAIAPSGSEAITPNGFQDAITPPWQTRLQIIWMVGYIALLIVGSLQLWYFGVVAVVVALLTNGVARALLPSRAAWYLRLIANSLANREADYQRAGDTLRAEAAREIFGRLARLLERAASANQRVPSMSEARATPLGQVDQ